MRRSLPLRGRAGESEVEPGAPNGARSPSPPNPLPARGEGNRAEHDQSSSRNPAACGPPAAPRTAPRDRVCGRDSSSFIVRARVSTSPAGAPTAMRPFGKPITSPGVAATVFSHGRVRMIEMQDARRLAIDLEHVEIAIGVERIARVVARDHHGDARGIELMQRRDAAPARRAAGHAILQIHVAHRQRHDRDARPPRPWR